MDKKTTQMIKGVAILLMVMHHFCAKILFPDLDGVLLEFGATCKICVAVYAVLSGYGYFFAKEKNVRYGLKKIWGLLQIYWISLFTLFIPLAIFWGGWKLTPITLLVQLFALLPNLNWFAWYVFFYIFCMLVMPFIYKVLRYKPLINFGMALFVPYIIEAALHSIPNYESNTVIHDLFSCFLYFPCFLVGYLMAQHRLLEKANGLISRKPINVAVSVVGIFAVFAARYMVPSVAGFLLDVFYVPALLWCLSNLFNAITFKPVEVVFETLGKYSTGIWFFHAVFFSTYVCDVFQPILRAVKQPILMYLWCVVLSLLGAVFYHKVLDAIHFVFRKLKRS